MKVKKIAAALSLIAIVGSSVTALAKTYYLDTGIWKAGTTGWFGGGTVYSEYLDYSHDWYSATARNAYGKTVSVTKKAGDTYAKASTTAIKFLDDYSYYDYGNYIYR